MEPKGATPDKTEAVEALTRYLASYIRQDDNPDHSGPEDAAEQLAEIVIARAEMAALGWREILLAS